MVEPDPKSNIPWSVKGVSKEAREAVKKAAAEQGITMGEWLTQAIRAGDEPRGFTNPGSASSLAPEDSGEQPEIARRISTDGRNPHDPLRQGIADRIADSERRILAVVEPLKEIIHQMASRIDTLESRTAGMVPDQKTPQVEAPSTYRKSGWDE